MKRTALVFLAVLSLWVGGPPTWGAQSVPWSSLPTGEFSPLPNPASTVLQSLVIGSGQWLRFEGGNVLTNPQTVCHVWINQTDQLTPAGSPWVEWGTGNYQNIPLPGMTIYGPLKVFFWCAGTGPVYYSLLWTLGP